MNPSCKDNFCLLQRSNLQNTEQTNQLVFPAKLDEKINAEALTDHEKYMAVLNLIFHQRSGDIITEATLAEEHVISPRVSKTVSIAN
jgi:hypothetical protein